MTNEEWLEINAKVIIRDVCDEKVECYVSRIDEAYIAFVGMESEVAIYVERGLTQVQNQSNVAGNSANIGFNEEEQRWYGWSHRAMYGFGVESKVSKGDCAYRAANLEDEFEAAIDFWDNADHEGIAAELDLDDPNNIIVRWKYSDKIPNEKLHNKISSVGWHFNPDEFGRGEWTAETLTDAREMACDFARGVS